MNGRRFSSIPESGPDRVVALDYLRWLISTDAHRNIRLLADQGARALDAAVEYREWLCALVADEVDFALGLILTERAS